MDDAYRTHRATTLVPISFLYQLRVYRSLSPSSTKPSAMSMSSPDIRIEDLPPSPQSQGVAGPPVEPPSLPLAHLALAEPPPATMMSSLEPGATEP